ncbi:Glucose-methanol-choline oxidoreductase [Penicillium brevicompactum]|uniref:Glucose-methanol-choline oxidoreductase n=1 Tax=Penicillium brevicompactum TaxID=5074 RepID=UPI002542282C|nr:Glucose-methanol-choline oxidoreductase [Penicillium brevicompactum]KAJ5334398.1 Glucose-methanol-choline oxidoreductase [Penicillium brevicompactum]
MIRLNELTALSLLVCCFFACLSEGKTRFRSHGRLAGDATFDYVVVGGGTAGLTIASRLAEHQYQVAVVEAGGYYEYMYPLARVPGACSLGAGADVRTTTPIDWGFMVHGAPGANFRDIHYPRGKCLGGSSASNFMIYQRPSKQSLEVWAELVNDSSYLFDNVLPYFKKTVSFSPPFGTRFANATPLFNATSFDHDGQPVQVSYPKYATPFSTWVKRGMSEVGIEEVEDFNSGSLMGHQYCAMTIQQADASRSSSESAFLQTGFRFGSWTVYQFAMAKKIIFDANHRATGVVVEQGNQFILSARREVIICAGAFQSPQLLMVSGLGPAEIIHAHGIDLVVDLPGVGQNMWDHVFFGPSYEVNVPTLGMLNNDLISMLVQVEMWLLGGNGILTNPSTDYIAFEKLPKASRSQFSDMNEQDLAWFPSDWPEVEYIAGSAFEGNFSDPYAEQPRNGKYATVAGVLVAPTSRGNITIRSADMADPPTINPNCRARVFGVTGLRVVDASSFPVLPPGHPQSTVYMLAEKIAADIISGGPQ